MSTLALGDSLAYGFHTAQFEEDLAKGEGPCIPGVGCIEPAAFNDGYVDDFGAALQLHHPGLQIINDGCPGETTKTLVDGPGEPYTNLTCANGPGESPFPLVWLHHPYTPSPNGSQLSDALAILKELHRAARKAQIVVLGLYNPYVSVLKPEGTGDRLVAAFNAAQAKDAARVPRASFANPEPLFNPSIITRKPEVSDLTRICAFTAMCPGGTFSVGGDFHPSKLGYLELAGVAWTSFVND